MQRSTSSETLDRTTDQSPVEGAAEATLTVMLVDGETLVRSALARMMRAEDGIEVVAAASEPSQAVVAARGHKPDVIVYDPHDTRGTADAVDLIEQLADASSESSIIVLTTRYLCPRSNPCRRGRLHADVGRPGGRAQGDPPGAQRPPIAESTDCDADRRPRSPQG